MEACAVSCPSMAGEIDPAAVFCTQSPQMEAHQLQIHTPRRRQYMLICAGPLVACCGGLTTTRLVLQIHTLATSRWTWGRRGARRGASSTTTTVRCTLNPKAQTLNPLC